MTNPTIFAQTFSSKSNAIRGAKRAALNPESYRVDPIEGRFKIVDITPAPVVAKSTTTRHKQIVNTARSTVLKPVEKVHGFLAKNGKTLTRKAAVEKLVQMGINYSTARTQYQRWFAQQPR